MVCEKAIINEFIQAVVNCITVDVDFVFYNLVYRRSRPSKVAMKVTGKLWDLGF